MKKCFLLSLSVILAVGSVPVFANDNSEIPVKVKESFGKEFPGAAHVKWDHEGEYQVASFVFDGVRVEAFYNPEGELEGYARGIQFAQLPFAVIRTFEKRFSNACFLEGLEVSNEEGTSYWISVETKSKRYRVQANAAGSILQVKKIKQPESK